MLLGGVETSSGEVRGTGVLNGNLRRIQKGEFAVIPAGTPHWISDIDGDQILYIVAKVAAPGR